jgi:multiple sugar transport system permease protein
VRSSHGLRRWQPHLFFYPSLLLVGAVSFIPLFYALRQSFHGADYLETGAFVGLANYVDLLTRGGALLNIGRSIAFVAGTLLLTLPIGIGLALLLDRPIRFRGFFRTVLMVPWIVSQLVTGLMWMWLYDGRVGPIAHFLKSFGLQISGPLTDTTWALPSLILANTWHSYPLVMVFTLAALQTIPAEVREASRIDTPSAWRRFVHVTLPLVRNTALVAIVLTTLHTFNTVTTVLVMTGGGPAEATEVLALRVFKEGFQFYRMEVAATAAVIIFALNILFSIAYIRVMRSERV